jgi:hypothetical protein
MVHELISRNRTPHVISFQKLNHCLSGTRADAGRNLNLSLSLSLSLGVVATLRGRSDQVAPGSPRRPGQVVGGSPAMGYSGRCPQPDEGSEEKTGWDGTRSLRRRRLLLSPQSAAHVLFFSSAPHCR